MKKNKTLTREEILHLAKLSNLKLTDVEIEKYRKQLEDTVEYVNNLNELDTKKVIPASQTTQMTDIFFTDGEKNERGLSQKAALKNAKKKKDGYFTVKRIL